MLLSSRNYRVTVFFAGSLSKHFTNVKSAYTAASVGDVSHQHFLSIEALKQSHVFTTYKYHLHSICESFSRFK